MQETAKADQRRGNGHLTDPVDGNDRSLHTVNAIQARRAMHMLSPTANMAAHHTELETLRARIATYALFRISRVRDRWRSSLHAMSNS